MIRSWCSAPLSGVVVDGGRRSCGVGGDVVLSDLSDQGVADEDVVDQFGASSIFAAEALGFGDAWGQIPRRCGPVVGASKPLVAISEPGGPLRIWVVAASTSSLRSPSPSPMLVVVRQQVGGGGADGDSFGGPAI